MRRMGMLLMGLALTATPAALEAQAEQEKHDRRTTDMRGHVGPAARVLALNEDLGLTEEQTARLEAIRARFRGAAEPLVEQLREAMPERAHMMRARRQLTPEQREELRERMAERRAERGEMSDAEREQMRARMAERRAEERERMEGLRPVMEELRELREEERAEVEAVLTAEQVDTLRSLREARREMMRERMREHRGSHQRGGERGAVR